MPTGRPAEDSASGNEIAGIAGRILQRGERRPVDKSFHHGVEILHRVEVTDRAV